LQISLDYLIHAILLGLSLLQDFDFNIYFGIIPMFIILTGTTKTPMSKQKKLIKQLYNKN